MSKGLKKGSKALLQHLEESGVKSDHLLSNYDEFMTKQDRLKKSVLNSLIELRDAGLIDYSLKQESYLTSSAPNGMGRRHTVRKLRDVVLVTLLVQDEA